MRRFLLTFVRYGKAGTGTEVTGSGDVCPVREMQS
jgi:hypothetical protein